MKYLFLFILSFLPVHLTYAAPLSYKILPAASSLSFEVDSTLHKVHGKTYHLEGHGRFDLQNLTAEFPISIQIPVFSLDTKNNSRNKALFKMFSAEDSPLIEWNAQEFRCRKTTEIINCHSEGILRINSIEQNIPLNIEVIPEEDRLRARGTANLRTDDFKLRPPSVLGIIKVAKEVRIHFDTVWILSESPQAP